MDKITVDLFGLVFRILLRYWARDNKSLSQDIVDIEQFAQKCGLSIWEAKKFSRSIDGYIDLIAEDFIKEIGSEIPENERKKAILNQIRSDIKKLNINESKLIREFSNAEDLRNAIMFQSQEERKTWNDIEVGVYTNCVRYISKAGIDFVSKLPSFTPEVLRIVIQRQEEYHKELYDILKDIHSMTSLIKGTEVTYREYESIYREKLIEKYSKVEIIGSGLRDRNIRRYDISSAYVELNCITNDESDEYDEEDEEIELSKVFSYNNVVWIKGEAGSGKTTFLQWVAVCAAKNEYQKIENIRNTIPIVIGLRSVEWPLNLQDVVNKITGVFGNNCPEGWILELLNKKRAILLFDGLDEIPQLRREETYSFIEDIVEQHSQIKVLLTARNSVNDYIDCNSAYYEIVPMKIESIKKFILYWHRSILRRDAIINDEKIKKLQHNLILKIVESQALKVLARNPLLCAMICALNFVNNEQLPDDKMELYDKCCEMLMDTRDNQRNINTNIYENIPLLDYSRKRKILEEIAYWMMIGGVSSEDKYNVVDYLEHLIKDTNIIRDGQYNTETILNFFIERSGIIREPEEGVIDFIHKTFMEFLAVKAICRNCAWNVLVKEACNVNWKETIIMCFREMGKTNVEQILKKLVDEGKTRNDDRYILIASLGASNAIFLSDNNIKEEIDALIKTMIPPKQKKLYEIAQAGTYLLPFLKDTYKFSNQEKERCLILLDYLGTHEAIPDIISYVSGNGNSDIKLHALSLLSEFEDSILEEYNVREQLINIMRETINGDSLTTYERMLAILGNKEIMSQDIKFFEGVQSLNLICGGTEEGLYTEETKFLFYLKKCKKVNLIGNIQRIDFLEKFTCITHLKIKASNDLSESIRQLLYLKNLETVKCLYIEAKQLNYLCKEDLSNMKNIELFELLCYDNNLELNFKNFDDFVNLKKLILDVDVFLAEELRKLIPVWANKKEDFIIRVSASKKTLPSIIKYNII